MQLEGVEAAPRPLPANSTTIVNIPYDVVFGGGYRNSQVNAFGKYETH